MSLRHVSLPVWTRRTPPKFPSYAVANDAQSRLQQQFLSWKADNAASRETKSTTAANKTPRPCPLPTLISFTPSPTFTLGRRQSQPLSQEETAALQAPFLLSHDKAHNSVDHAYSPVITHAPRGGLATYHGPGQVVLWPVIDLHSPLYRHLTVRDYACLLEKTTIATLARFGIQGFTTKNPGVWVRHGQGQSQSNGVTEAEDGEERKIAALGVHLRRHITGLGVAINCTVPVSGPPISNPWARIVPCGLGEKGVTSIQAQLSEDIADRNASIGSSAAELGGETMIASIWAREFSTRLGLGESAVHEHSWEKFKHELDIHDEDASTAYPEAERLKHIMPEKLGTT